MKKHLITLTLLMGLFSAVLSADDALERLERQYENFNYGQCIALADSLLKQSEDQSDEQLVKIHLYKALAHYSLAELDQAIFSFHTIFRINPDFELDSSMHSPKVIAFFQQVKNSLPVTKNKETEIITQTIRDTIFVSDTTLTIPRGLIAKSLLVPGLAHFSINKPKTGTILGVSALTTLSAALVYTLDTHNKRDDYLQHTEPAAIAGAYTSFNDAFKRRNLLWAAFGCVWLYSQIDFFFIQDLEKSPTISVTLPRNNKDSVMLGFVVGW